MPDSPSPPRPALSEGRKLLSLQVLRALAALCVVVHHTSYDADTIAARLGRAPLGLDGVFDWTFGIHLFFVISGFIMVRTARGFGELGGPWSFLGRRLLRIVPLYWLLTTLVLVGAALAPDLLNVPVKGWRLVAGSYLFIPVTRINGEIRPVLGQGWTLDYEMAFYVVFAGAMVCRRRTGLWVMAAALIGLVIAGRLAVPSTPALAVWTDPLLLEFLLGIGVGLVTEAGFRLGGVPAALLAATGLLAAILLRPGGFATGIDTWIIAGFPAAAILLACACGPASRPWLPVLALASIGDASYSLYLTHPFAIRLLRVGWTVTIGTRLPPGLFVPLAIAASIVLALLVFRLVERPMTSALRRRFPLTRPGSARGEDSELAIRP